MDYPPQIYLMKNVLGMRVGCYCKERKLICINHDSIYDSDKQTQEKKLYYHINQLIKCKVLEKKAIKFFIISIVLTLSIIISLSFLSSFLSFEYSIILVVFTILFLMIDTLYFVNKYEKIDGKANKFALKVADGIDDETWKEFCKIGSRKYGKKFSMKKWREMMTARDDVTGLEDPSPVSYHPHRILIMKGIKSSFNFSLKTNTIILNHDEIYNPLYKDSHIYYAEFQGLKNVEKRFIYLLNESLIEFGVWKILQLKKKWYAKYLLVSTLIYSILLMFIFFGSRSLGGEDFPIIPIIDYVICPIGSIVFSFLISLMSMYGFRNFDKRLLKCRGSPKVYRNISEFCFRSYLTSKGKKDQIVPSLKELIRRNKQKLEKEKNKKIRS